jgi:hypothetical protein
MKDMYEIMDRWGLGRHPTIVVLTGNQLLLVLKVCYLMERKTSNVMMMKE